MLQPLATIDKKLDKGVVADEAHQFGMAVAAKMRKFSEYQFAVARRDIELGSPAAPFLSPATHPMVQTFHPMTLTITPMTYASLPTT